MLHHHLTGPMGVSPHNTSYKSFASWFMNVLALCSVVSVFFLFFLFWCGKNIFESYCNWLKIVTELAGLYRDLKTRCIMVMITITVTTRPNLSTNRMVYASCVHAFVVHFIKLTFDSNANMWQMFSTCMFPNILCFLFT